MTAAAGAAAPAAADLLYELEPLDWVVIAAALVSLVVLVLELRRARDETAAPDTPED